MLQHIVYPFNDSVCLLESQTQDLLLFVVAPMQSLYSVLYADHADLIYVNLCVCVWGGGGACLCVCTRNNNRAALAEQFKAWPPLWVFCHF